MLIFFLLLLYVIFLWYRAYPGLIIAMAIINLITNLHHTVKSEIIHIPTKFMI